MKQAVVLIHGIGEQVPMDTLRGFVDAVWVTDPDARRPHVPPTPWSKPDTMSGDFELRRITTAENRDRQRTDFFEFYWAHLMEGTTLSHIRAWARVLLFRRPWRVPKQLLGAWCLLAFASATIVVALTAELFGYGPKAAWYVVAGAAIWIVLGTSPLGMLLDVAGDAARYLHVAPPNIEIRRKIRQAGVDLVQKLHASGEYDRIVIVGHSLGSVIGYDILRYLWTRYHDAHVARVPDLQPTEALRALEAMVEPLSRRACDIADFQAAQAAYLHELQQQGSRWLVTDFVTLGSPLSHAAILMARDDEQFAQKKAEREFPTCPPVLETVERQPRFVFKKDKVWVPHHGAVFAPTRWTNLYFPCRATFWGDVIGGELAPTFGSGIRDVAVHTTLRGELFAHTLYWSREPDETGETESWIAALRRAVRVYEPLTKADKPAETEASVLPRTS